MKDRSMYYKLWQELSAAKPMVFLSGARQSGKTTLAQFIAKQNPSHIYTNWDVITDRKKIQQIPYFFEDTDKKGPHSPLVIFDEIHKYRLWKNYIKGAYDKYHEHFQFLILGGGRLDLFQKNEDSLAGRYYQAHIFPLTIAELTKKQLPFDVFWKNPLTVESSPSVQPLWNTLRDLTGFPEPFFAGSRNNYQRWSNTYSHQLIREDIRALTLIQNIDSVEALYFLLPSRVGSLLSTANLARDIQTSFNSAKSWLEAFDRFYLTFRLRPWTKKISRAITQEPKLYLMDYAQIENPAARFENMVALELLRAITHWNDLGAGRFSLHFIRNKNGEEADFLIADKNRPRLIIETKKADAHVDAHLKRFQDALEIPAIQLVDQPGLYRVIPNNTQQILVASAASWLAQLP